MDTHNPHIHPERAILMTPKSTVPIENEPHKPQSQA